LTRIQKGGLREVEVGETHAAACGKADVKGILVLDVAGDGSGILIRILRGTVDERV